MILSWTIVKGATLILGLVLLVRPSTNLPIPRMIDLTYSFFNLTPTYPGHKQFEIINPKLVRMSETARYKTEEFLTSEHAGTHMDAPDHFVDDTWTIDEIPIERFEGPAAVVDITQKAKMDPNAAVSVQDLEDWETKHGRIPAKSVVLMYSGWGQLAHNQTAYFGSNNVTNLHFPGFSGEACEWLMSERNIVGVGVDTASCDVRKSLDFPCHHFILKANGYVLENVANLDQMPAIGALLKAYPMKIKDGTGAPTRVIAVLPSD